MPKLKEDEVNFILCKKFNLPYQNFNTPAGHITLKESLLENGYEISEYYHPIKHFGTILFHQKDSSITATGYHAKNLPESLMLAVIAVVLK